MSRTRSRCGTSNTSPLLGEGLRLAALGLGSGLLLALAGARVIRSQLYGVGSADPATYVALAAVLLVVAAAATWIPARRATRWIRRLR